MCTITNKITNKKQVTGYKVALKINGKYYSPATGIEYKAGPVKTPRRMGKHRDESFLPNLLRKNCLAYNQKLKGLTSVFIRKSSAMGLLSFIRRKEDGVIIRISLSQNLCYGFYRMGAEYDCYAGSHIDSIEEVEP